VGDVGGVKDVGDMDDVYMLCKCRFCAGMQRSQSF
jgi:hypothetical protein